MSTLQSVVAIVASIAAIIWGFYAAVTKPIVRQVEFMREDLGVFRKEITTRFDRVDTHLDRIEERLGALEKKVEVLEVKAWR